MISHLNHRELGHVNVGSPHPDYHIGAWAVIAAGVTAKLHSSHNVDSLTDNGAGDFTLTYQVAFGSASDYAVMGSFWAATGNDRRGHLGPLWTTRPTSTAVRVLHASVLGTSIDLDPTTVVCMGRF